MNTSSVYRQFSRQARIRAAAILNAVVLSLGADLPLEAGTFTWTGNENSNAFWKSNNNWNGIGGAGPNDDLIFPASAIQKTNTNDFTLNTNFNSLTFTGRDYVI